MTSCYTFKEYNYDTPIFNNVDATYIIHLEGNGRLDNIESQLSKFHPTKKVYIVFNKGYKNSKKEDYIDSPSKDLIDAFYNIFQHSRENNYENILVLEDDFNFDDKINEQIHGENIDKFIHDKTHDNFIYYLGAIVYLQTCFAETHNRLFLSTGTHSCIYSKKCIDYFLDNVDKTLLQDWDIYTNFNCQRFKYYTQLCYQTFPDTENSKSWHRGSYVLMILVFIQRSLFKLLKLDTYVQPGFNIFEIVSRILFWFILFIILYYITFIIK